MVWFIILIWCIVGDLSHLRDLKESDGGDECKGAA